MSTISSMARSNYMMLKYAQNNGKSLFASNVSSGRSSLLSNGNSLWGNYASSHGSATSTMSGLFGVRSAMNDMVKSYDTAAKVFHEDFASTMEDLSKASSAIKGMNFEVGDASAVSSVTNEDGTVTTKKSETLTEALKGIEDFASKYNDAIDFFNNNADISKSMKNMTNVFSDTTYRSGLLSSIGIAVGNDGKMKLDEDVLTKSLTENPAKVERILGKGGLASKADQHISFARAQQNRLFPSITTALGSATKSGAVYSGNSLLNLSSYSNIGNLLNTWI